MEAIQQRFQVDNVEATLAVALQAGRRAFWLSGLGQAQPLLGTTTPPYRVGAIPCGRPGGGGRPISTILILTPIGCPASSCYPINPAQPPSPVLESPLLPAQARMTARPSAHSHSSRNPYSQAARGLR